MNGLGVVDPIGLPKPLARLLAAVPRATWVFIGAAVIAVFADVRNGLGADLARDAGQIIVAGTLTGLLIALPGIALIRNPRVPTLAPVAYLGLVLIAVGTIVSMLVNALLSGEFGVPAGASLIENVVTALVHLSGLIIAAIGWLAIARALVRRNVPAGPATTVIAGVAAAAIVGTVVAGLGSTIGIAADGTNDPSWVWFVVIGFGAHLVIGLSRAALAWTFVRSVSSSRSGAILAAGLWSITVAIGAVLALVPGSILSQGVIEANLHLWNTIGTVVALLAPVLLASAVALGLLDRGDTPPTTKPGTSA